jgi:CRP/FNR family cyclic AMP-dependent transcriptional regulator
MNRRRQFFSTIGLGFLLAGGAAAVPREELAAAAKPHRIQAARGHGSVLDNCGFAASENQEVALWHEVEFLTPTEFLDQIAGSPRAARELIQRLSQRLREADDRIINDERRSRPAHGTRKDADSQTAVELVNNAYLAAKTPWLQRQLHAPLGLGDLPFIVGRGPVAGEGPPQLQPDLKLDDTVPFRLSRNHFMIEKRDGSYYVRDLCSTLGTIVNGEPIGNHFRGDDAPLQAGENEVIAGGVDSPFVFSLVISRQQRRL